MKRFISSLVVCVFALVVFGADAATSRVGVEQKRVMSSARMPSIAVTSVGNMTASNLKEAPVTPSETTEPDDEKEPEEPAKDMREKEREACIRNNIGVGNTFVWASRYSDINNYSTMVEDVEHPENNTCFVLVGLKSSDPRVDLSDIADKYFEMGRTITCGSWVDENLIEKRILDAKKKGRTWATVGGAVGGAALGVGSMELFGNKLIGGAVQGQKDERLSVQEQFRSYVLSLKDAERDSLIAYFKQMDEECSKLDSNKPVECNGYIIEDGVVVPYSELKDIKAN